MMAVLTRRESNPSNNPNHPVVKCVDAIGPDGAWTSADDPSQRTSRPYRIFDVLNQRHIGPRLPFKWMAKAYLRLLGGAKVSG